jgi:hypothetical protein
MTVFMIAMFIGFVDLGVMLGGYIERHGGTL